MRSPAFSILTVCFIGRFAAAQATFQRLDTDFTPRGLSLDGRVIVGVREPGPNPVAIRWDLVGTPYELAGITCWAFYGSFANQDASIVAGSGWIGSGSPDFCWATNTERAVAWDGNGALTQLPILPPANGWSDSTSWPMGISASGGVVIGSASGWPVRWTNAGVERLFDSAGVALGVSHDGNVIIATTMIGNSYQDAFVWSARTGDPVVTFPQPMTPDNVLDLQCISGDGRIAYGQAGQRGAAGTFHAVQWTRERGVEPIAGLPGGFVFRGTNQAGTMAVGGVRRLDGAMEPAMIWHQGMGVVDLAAHAQANGADLQGMSLGVVLSMSGDGRVMLGASDTGQTRVYWILTLPAWCGTADFNLDGDVGTDQDIEAFFGCLAGTCCGSCWRGGADFNGDGDTATDQDIEAFFRALAGLPC